MIDYPWMLIDWINPTYVLWYLLCGLCTLLVLIRMWVFKRGYVGLDDAIGMMIVLSLAFWPYVIIAAVFPFQVFTRAFWLQPISLKWLTTPIKWRFAHGLTRG